MVRLFASLLVITLTITLISALTLPGGFPVCKRSNPDFDKCFIKAASDALPILRHGVKALGLYSLDPIFVPSVVIKAGTTSVRFEQKFKNYNIYGFENFQALNVTSKLNDNGGSLEFVLLSPNCLVVADYEFNGQILVLPIKGNGKFEAKFKNMVLKVSTTIEVDKAGYAEVTNVTVDMIPEHIYIHLGNLFNGHEELGKEINTVINENWQGLYLDVKDGYNELIATLFSSYLNNLFKKIPYDDLFPQ